MLNTRALVVATLIGTVLQVAMVVAGHTNKSIAGLFAVGGMGFSLVAGVLYARMSGGGSAGSLAGGGAIAGGVCALIGIFVSYMLGDVPATLLALGTISSVVTGAIGGWAGRFFVKVVAPAGLILLATATGAREANAASTPVATLADFQWLVGSWEGTMATGVGIAHVVYDAPHGGLMTGVMHLVDKNDKILVVELISLVSTPKGIEMRFRHFSPTLEAYEPEFKQSMLLTSHAAEVDVFENQVPYSKTLMSTQARVTKFLRQPDGSFVGRSDIVGEDGTPSVIEGTYRRVRF